MRTVYIQGFEIKYSNKQIKEAVKLREMIGLNPEIYKLILPKKITMIKPEKNYFYLSSIKDYFTTEAENIIRKINDYSEANNLELEEIYLKLLLNKHKQAKHEENIDEINNLLYTVLSIKYYKNKKDILNFIENISEKDKKILLEWLKNQERIKLLNRLYEELDNINQSISKENLSLLITYLDKSLDSPEYKNNKKANNYKYSQLSLQELDIYFETFLRTIDENNILVNIYNEYKKKNIIFQEVYFNEDVFKSNIKNKKIYLKYNNTILDFVALTNNFFKYYFENIKSQTKETTSFITSLAVISSLDFLEEIGYTKEEINTLKKHQELNSLNQYDSLKEILKIYKLYQENGIIEKDTLKEQYINKYQSLKNAYLELESATTNKTLKNTIKQEIELLENIEKQEERINTYIDTLTIKLIKLKDKLPEAMNHLLDTYFLSLISNLSSSPKELLKSLLINPEKLEYNDIDNLLKDKKYTRKK